MILNNSDNIMLGNTLINKIYSKNSLIWERPGSNPNDWVYTIENNEVRITGYLGSSEKIWIPSMIENYPVRYIGTGEEYSTLTGIDYVLEIYIPNSVKYIEDYAFYNRYYGHLLLKKIIIGDGVERIGEKAFYNCRKLEYVYMGLSVKEICLEAFYNAALETANNKATFILGNNVEFIDWRAFSGCEHLLSLTLPDTLKEIHGEAFYGCSGLTEILIPDSVTIMEEGAFKDCRNLSNVTLSNSITQIYSLTFAYCDNLNTIYIPSNVTYLDIYAFRDCSSLTDVYIPKNCTYHADAFHGSDNINLIPY